MLSLNLPTLWELRKNEKDVEELFLHLEWPEPIGLISLVFYGEQVQLLRENQEIHSLGILHEFDIQTGDTKQALFITGIREGLDFVFD
ncbi:hypothetical protein [Tepidibacillus fermentans]|nr:hypothetical protein [Tepidibacillus fermentans]